MVITSRIQTVMATDRDPHIQRIQQGSERHALACAPKHRHHEVRIHAQQEQHAAFQRDRHEQGDKRDEQAGKKAQAEHGGPLERNAAVQVQLAFVP